MTDHELRVERGGYTTLPDSVWKYGLSARAIGILVLMLSKPPAWRFSTERLAQEVREGRDAVRAAVQELEDAGFVYRQQISEDGLWRTLVKVAPTPKYRAINNGFPVVGASVVGGSGALTKTDNQDIDPAREPSVPGPTPSAPLMEITREAEAGVVGKRAAARRGKRPKAVEGDDGDGLPSDFDAAVVKPTAFTNAPTVARYFKDLCRLEFPMQANKTNLEALSGTFARVRRESPGVTHADLARAAELFFEDTARLHRPGVPAWQNFLHHLTKLVEQARREGGSGREALTTEEKSRWFDAADDPRRKALSSEEKKKWFA